MNFSSIINQIAVLFLVLFVGYFARKFKLIDEHASKKIATLIVKVMAPMLVLGSMMKDTSLQFSEIIKIFLVAVGVYLFLFIMTILVPRLLRVDKNNIGIYKFMIMFSNVGFMGYPVIKAIYGNEGVFYASIFNLPFNILIYTLGIYFVSLNNKENVAFEAKEMINPAVIAVFVGLFFFITGYKVPIFLSDTVDMLGGLTTPLSMLVIGSSLANIKFKNIFTNSRLYINCVLKLLVIPFIIFTFLSALNFKGMMLGVPVVISGMPVAANAVILCKEYGGNDILASEGVFISVMLSIITIPLLVLMLSA